jgi:hypothetical protein
MDTTIDTAHDEGTNHAVMAGPLGALTERRPWRCSPGVAPPSRAAGPTGS